MVIHDEFKQVDLHIFMWPIQVLGADSFPVCGGSIIVQVCVRLLRTPNPEEEATVEDWKTGRWAPPASSVFVPGRA